MTTETTTPATETTTPTEPKKTGVAAAEAMLAEHWKKREAEAAEAEEPGEGEAETPEDKNKPAPPKKKAGLVKALREERAAGKALKSELAALRAEVEALKKGGGATPPPQASKALSKGTWLDALAEADIDEAEALDTLQKRALQNGGVPPAVQKLIDKQAKALEAYKAKLEEVTQGLTSKEEAAAHEAGWRALAAEARKVEAYPELDGYDWEIDIAPAAEQAVKYLVGRGAESVTPEEVLGLVNNAFKLQHEKASAILAKRQPSPPAKKPAPPPAAPPKGKGKPPADEDELPPVEPSGARRKVKLPTQKEIERRIARQLG